MGEKTIGLQRMKRQKIGSFEVVPFHVPHGETECDGWLIDTPDGRILFITDAEYCPYDFSKMHINYGLIECNYAEDYIRIEDSSPKYNHVLTGHMELETCKRLIQKINSVSLRSIGLIHISAGNGNPVRFTEEIQEMWSLNFCRRIHTWARKTKNCIRYMQKSLMIKLKASLGRKNGWLM